MGPPKGFRRALDRDGVYYPGYFVSSRGDVISFRTNRGAIGTVSHILKPNCQKYKSVELCRGNGVSRRESVHVLVARVWIGVPSDSALEVNHKNTRKYDNHYKNLEWITRQGNIDHARANGHWPTGSTSALAKLTEEEVIKIRVMKIDGWSHKRLGALFGVNSGTISCIVNRTTWRHV